MEYSFRIITHEGSDRRKGLDALTVIIDWQYSGLYCRAPNCLKY